MCSAQIICSTYIYIYIQYSWEIDTIVSVYIIYSVNLYIYCIIAHMFRFIPRLAYLLM